MSNPRQPIMPKVTQLPEPPRRNTTESVYSEEALRVAQRDIDQRDEIHRLGTECEDWRRRALMAESEIKRLEKRSADLEGALERQAEKLTFERDTAQRKLNNVVSQFHAAGAIILQCLNAADTETSGGQVNMGALARELEPPTDRGELQPGDEPLPSVVTAGPRETVNLDPSPEWLRQQVERKGP